MNQDRDGVSRKPQSSSSSNTAGTHALRITIDPEPAAAPAGDEQAAPLPGDAAGISDAPEADHLAPAVSDESAALAVAAELGEPVTDSAPMAVIDEPVAAPADEVEPAAPSEPDAAMAAPVEFTAPANEPVDAPSMDEQPASAIADEPMPAPAAEALADELAAEPAGSDSPVTDTAPALVTNEPAAVTVEEPDPVPVAEPSASTAEPVVEAGRETLADPAATPERIVASVDEMSHVLSAMMDDARHDAALIGRKLMEFVQANFENNIEMARNYAGARSMPEIVNVHTAYVRRQIDLLSRQAEEFRALTSDMAAKRVNRMQSRSKA
jgi:hypothetical protein